MGRRTTLWIIAFIITIATAYYQRVTGPTYPVMEKTTIDGSSISGVFDRSHDGDGNHLVEIKVADTNVIGNLYWKRYKTNDDWNMILMKREDDKLSASLPHQPPAGKLLYNVVLQSGNSDITIPSEPVVIRFKGAVPHYFLIPHVIFMFVAMLLTARTGLEIFNKEPKYFKLTVYTLVVLFIGGLILGPIVQKYAFGEFWTGVPFGIDLTDNKTLIAFIGWLIAFIAVQRNRNPKFWVIFAAILMFVIFLIPHSVLGSELDYNKYEKSNVIFDESN